MKKVYHLFNLLFLILTSCSEIDYGSVIDTNNSSKLVRLVIEDNKIIGLVDEGNVSISDSLTLKLAELMLESGIVENTNGIVFFESKEKEEITSRLVERAVGHTHMYAIQEGVFIKTEWHPIAEKRPDGTTVYNYYECNVYRIYYECESYLGNGSYCGAETNRTTHSAQ